MAITGINVHQKHLKGGDRKPTVRSLSVRVLSGSPWTAAGLFYRSYWVVISLP